MQGDPANLILHWGAVSLCAVFETKPRAYRSVHYLCSSEKSKNFSYCVWILPADFRMSLGVCYTHFYCSVCFLFDCSNCNLIQFVDSRKKCFIWWGINLPHTERWLASAGKFRSKFVKKSRAACFSILSFDTTCSRAATSTVSCCLEKFFPINSFVRNANGGLCLEGISYNQLAFSKAVQWSVASSVRNAIYASRRFWPIRRLCVVFEDPGEMRAESWPRRRENNQREENCLKVTVMYLLLLFWAAENKQLFGQG